MKIIFTVFLLLITSSVGYADTEVVTDDGFVTIVQNDYDGNNY